MAVMVLLHDRRIAEVTCSENGERLISLRQIHQKVGIDETKNQIGNQSDLFCFARVSVAERLSRAADSLPKGYGLLIKEAYRPSSLQKVFFDRAFRYYKKRFPEKNDEEIYRLTCQYTAPLEVAGHPTGGAVDLTLLKNGTELDMGSRFNEAPVEPENLSYTFSSYLSAAAKENRKILIDCMEKAGFVNYPAEWWHWSYGDRYWAFADNSHAFYSAVSEKEVENSNH